MNRILPLVILAMIAEITFTVWLGIVILGGNDPICIFLYLIFAAGVLSHIIHWIVSLVECSPHPVNSGKHTNWKACCDNKICNARCNLYNQINEIDTTPAKQQFKSFWGY